MLTFDHVHFYYKKGQPVVEDVSFTIQAGEFVAIVGANGSGKSTIAKLMDGLLLPKEGTVKLQQLDTSKQSDLVEIHQHIGFVFQNPEDQFITTTVMDEVLFGLENIRIPREEMRSRMDHALQAVHMEDYLEAMPHQLSGGQKQRVAIAAILAMRPQIIIFDEATSMLDPQGREQVLSIMHELHLQGMTIIHITHHMEEVLSAERILLIHKGRLKFDGDPVTFFETVPVKDFQLQLPFAVRLHQTLQLEAPISADWKEGIRSQWSIN
ncbi:energy-coupling factor transporter ATPase [Psychrobacillus sp. NPDC058041]|uniref:energy-coupling factor transporter ATPase n=1 Tax=Psychrobacillus sp. NPDC058041 TaxID=3346310 RepID=UPI0036DC8F27